VSVGLSATIKYLRRTTSAAAGVVLGTAIKYLCGSASIGLGTTIKYLRRTTSAAAGSGLGATISYLRRAASCATGIGLGTTIKYLRRTTRGAAGNGRAQRSSNCDKQRAAPRATVWAPRSSTSAAP
jgi:hypothetical protein